MTVEIKHESRVDKQPFIFPIGRKIGGGIRSETLALGKDFVVKRILPFWQWKKGWDKKLVDDLGLLERFLQPYIPSTGFVRCVDGCGRKNLLIVQERISARSLKDWSWSELISNSSVVGQLNDFADRVASMYQSTKRTPDLHGGGLINLMKQYDFRSTDNVVIDESGKVWLIDIDMIGPFWSVNWPGGRKHMQKIAEAVENFRQRLNARALKAGTT